MLSGDCRRHWQRPAPSFSGRVQAIFNHHKLRSTWSCCRLIDRVWVRNVLKHASIAWISCGTSQAKYRHFGISTGISQRRIIGASPSACVLSPYLRVWRPSEPKSLIPISSAFRSFASAFGYQELFNTSRKLLNSSWKPHPTAWRRCEHHQYAIRRHLCGAVIIRVTTEDINRIVRWAKTPSSSA